MQSSGIKSGTQLQNFVADSNGQKKLQRCNAVPLKLHGKSVQNLCACQMHALYAKLCTVQLLHSTNSIFVHME